MKEFESVPAHWKINRVRHMVQMLVSNIDKHTKLGETPVRLCNYVDVYKNDRITESLRFQTASANKDEIERFRIRMGDVAITKDSETWDDIGVPALIDYEAPDVVYGYHLATLRPKSELLSGAYLLRALQCRPVAVQFHVAANGVTRFALSHDSIKSAILPVPPPVEQEAIVRYLDWACGRLDRAIRAKRKIISLLNEQKQAIIQRAVTRGLDPSAPLRSSGIPWASRIPKHWRVFRSRYLFQEIDARSTNGKETPLSMSQKLGLVPSEMVEERRLVSESRIGAKLVDKGDIVLNRLKAHLGVFALATRPGLVSPDYTVLRPRTPVSPTYFEAVYRTPACRTELRQRAKGIVEGFWRLYTDDFYDIRVPVPPPEEQHRIMEHLAVELSGVTNAIGRTEQEIALLREYRTRLIADVVTGKLDVREAAANLPAEEPLGAAAADDGEVDEMNEDTGEEQPEPVA